MSSVLFHLEELPALRKRLDPLMEGLNVSWCAEDDEDRFRRLIPDTEVLWHVLRPVTARDLDLAPKLRLIQKLGSGVNTIDLEAARERGIAVSNMPGANASAVAEATVLLMLATLRSAVALDRATREGRGWPLDPTILERVGELGTRTVGLVGYGNVARRVEAIATAMGAEVVHTSRTDDGKSGWRPLDDLLHQSDVVSIHVPLTESTLHLIGAEQLSIMGERAVLINTSRGQVIDEGALVDALRHGRIAGAGLDVFSDEPIGLDNPLLAMEQVVLSPHSAWLTPETIERCVAIAADNVRRLDKGRELHNRVI